MCLVRRADVGERREAGPETTSLRPGLVTTLRSWDLILRAMESYQSTWRKGVEGPALTQFARRVERKDRVPQRACDWATFFLGKAGWESLCSDPGTPAWRVWGTKIHTLSSSLHSNKMTLGQLSRHGWTLMEH